MHKERLKFRLCGGLIIVIIVLAILPLFLAHSGSPTPGVLNAKISSAPLLPHMTVQLDSRTLTNTAAFWG